MSNTKNIPDAETFLNELSHSDSILIAGTQVMLRKAYFHGREPWLRPEFSKFLIFLNFSIKILENLKKLANKKLNG
jgi:hypothetical protein